tara:strand:+ start:1873 stop:2139 length:267 start_codon:yes stop_codon:yes gene_type:complete
MDNQQAIYVGTGTKPDNFSGINFSVAESKLRDHWYEYNGERYVRLTIEPKKEPMYGKTHNVKVNTWKPKGESSAPVKQAVEENSDLPF